MEPKVRKQIYLTTQQNDKLKQLAEQRGMSETGIICQALEHEFEREKLIQDRKVGLLNQALAFIAERNAKYAGQGEPVAWNRDELYERGKTLQ